MEHVEEKHVSAARTEFLEAGAVCLRNVFDQKWIELVRLGVEQCAANPSALSKTWTGDSSGRFFQDGFAWNRVDALRQFVFQSPAARVVAELMDASRVHLYMDHILLREPCTNKATPWHHDTPYCFVEGQDFCTIWLPLDPVRRGEGLHLVRGSHRWGKMFLPVEFGSSEAYAGTTGNAVPYEHVPNIDANPDAHEILTWELGLGDCVVFYCSMLHSAPAHLALSGRRRVYSTRWVGNDARYTLRSWSVPPLPVDPGLKPGDPIGGELFPRVFDLSNTTTGGSSF
jgi:ectoine hydroxylase-related dioxygenase (phytanoyl-CoA dioxygenase family)